MDFVIKLLVLTNWESKTYDSILVIVNKLIKMVYYKPVKIMINTPSLAKVMIEVVIWYYNFLGIIITNWGSIFTSKFWLLLYYFFKIK